MNRTIYCFSCLVVLMPIAVLAQPSPDSLATYLRTHASTDTNYVRVMDKVILYRTYQKADYARADSLSRQMTDVATRLNDWLGVVRAWRSRGTISLLTANYEQAVGHFRKSLETAEQHNMPPLIVYGALSNLAAGYDKAGNPELVLQTALRAIQLDDKHHFTPRAPTPHRLVGGALVKLGRVQQALPYYREAGLIFRQLGDPRGIAIFEKQLGDLYNDAKQPQNALPHFREALRLATDQKFELLQFDALDGLARSMDLLNKSDEGLTYAKSALQLIEKQANKLGLCVVYGTLAKLYQTKKDYPNAETYLKKALALAEDNDYKDERKKLVQQMAALYGEQNKFQQAYAFQLAKNSLIDSAITVRTGAEVQRLVAGYEAEKKEAQIKLLRQEAQLRERESDRTHFLLIGSVLVLLLGLAASAWRLNRAKLRRLEEAQALRKQIAQDLHDEVGSTLSSISLLSGHTDKLLGDSRMRQTDMVGGGTDVSETAQKMVQKIYVDARQILDSIDEIIWTINPGNDSLQQIMLRLQTYAQPLMESKAIRFRFEADPALGELPISMDLRRNLYLIGKEAINNLVKYSKATEATVRFERQGGQLTVLIEDNGRGFSPQRASDRMGQRSMKARAEAMSGSLQVESAPNAGTALRLSVPIGQSSDGGTWPN